MNLILTGFQSTRPRGARQASIPCGGSFPFVSIHAPAGGATPQYKVVGNNIDVSIHAPAGGATWRADQDNLSVVCFNPRARGGRDSSAFPNSPVITRFNPRARGGRDAVIEHEDKFEMVQFQSTRPRGARHPGFCIIMPVISMFQSTRPRGARRLSSKAKTGLMSCFNPRARGGRDFKKR